MFIYSSMVSLVVPSISVTIALSSLSKQFKREDYVYLKLIEDYEIVFIL